LSTVQLRRIEQELKRGPEALGYEASLWTAPRVALVTCKSSRSNIHIMSATIKMMTTIKRNPSPPLG
jgi:hypothetical protein